MPDLQLAAETTAQVSSCCTQGIRYLGATSSAGVAGTKDPSVATYDARRLSA